MRREGSCYDVYERSRGLFRLWQFLLQEGLLWLVIDRFLRRLWMLFAALCMAQIFGVFGL